MYREAFAAFKNSFGFFCVHAAILLFFENMLEGPLVGLPMAVAVAWIAFFSHRMALKGETYTIQEALKSHANDEAKTKHWLFFGRYFVLLLGLFLAFGVIVFVASGTGLIQSTEPNSIETGIALSMMIAAILYGLLMAYVGTILPASAVKENSSWKSAIKRGKLKFWITLWRLVAGYLFWSLGSIALITVVMLSVPNVGIDLENGTGPFAISYFGYMLTCFGILLAATALSISYREAEEVLVSEGVK